MRTMCLSLAGTLMLMLLGGSVVLAQEGGEPAAGTSPIVVTGALQCDADADAAAASPAADGAEPAEGASIVNLHQWTASDPRLEGESAYTGRWQLYDPPAEDASSGEVESAVYSIVNDGGSWLCTDVRSGDPPRAEADRTTLVFTGQGEYEGLTAYLNVDFSQAPYAFTGLILTGDAPPWAEPQG